jgi:hypothetical protein
MNKTIAAMCVGLLLAAAAGPASARTKHQRHADPASAPQSHINSGWGRPALGTRSRSAIPKAAAERTALTIEQIEGVFR